MSESVAGLHCELNDRVAVLDDCGAFDKCDVNERRAGLVLENKPLSVMHTCRSFKKPLLTMGT